MVARIFRISGKFKQGIFVHKFSREILADSEKGALEKVLSEVGSKHKMKRRQIDIDEVKEVKPEEVKDPRVLAMLE